MAAPAIEVATQLTVLLADVRPLALEHRRIPVAADAGHPFVAAALGRDVDDAAGRQVVLGPVAAGEHLLVLDRLERHVGVGKVTEQVGDVESVDVVGILGDRGSAEGRQRIVAEAGRTERRTRRQQRDEHRVLADRNLLQLLGREVDAGLGAGGIDRVEARAANGHARKLGGLLARRRSTEIDRCTNARLDDDVVGRNFGPILDEHHVIFAGRNRSSGIATLRANRHLAGDTRFLVDDPDRAACCSGHLTVNVSGRALRQDRRREELACQQ